MDAEVDNRLGDSISYSIAGGPFMPIKGYVVDADPQDDFSGQPMDTLPRRKRVKVARALVPNPTTRDRITAPMLGNGTFRPMGNRPRIAGRYHIFDVERV